MSRSQSRRGAPKTRQLFTRTEHISCVLLTSALCCSEPQFSTCKEDASDLSCKAVVRMQEDATAKASSQRFASPDPSPYSQFSMSSLRVHIVLPPLAWNSSRQIPFPSVVLHRGKQFPIKLHSFLGLLSIRTNTHSKTIESVPRPGFQVSHGSREQLMESFMHMPNVY